MVDESLPPPVLRALSEAGIEMGKGPPSAKGWQRFLSVLALQCDVKQRARAEQELRMAKEAAEIANRAKDAFLANMSHELRTPMTVVIGATQLLLETELTLDQRRVLEGVQRSGQVLLGLINDILDYSKIGSETFQLSMRDFDFRSEIQEACDALRSSAEQKRIHFRLEIDEGVPRWLRGDPLRLRQVLTNLLANAIKFTERGFVEVSVRPQSTATTAIRIRAEVRDTGIGIRGSLLPDLFQPFAQGDASASRRHGGTGLGLAIAKQIVEQMGGQIGACSQSGEGSKFWFEVELELGSERAARLADRSVVQRSLSLVPRRAGEPRRVLVAEDNAFNQSLIVRTLETLGCEVDIVGSGRDALAAVQTRAYEAVIMDCQMPEMDGFEASRQIRCREGNGRRVPIIALTANALSGDREKCVAAGMDDYLSKPFSIIELRAKIKRWLSEPVTVIRTAAPIGPPPARVAPQAPERAALDLRRLRALESEMGSSEVLVELAHVFVEDVTARLEALGHATTADDLDAVHRLGHALHGACGNFGAPGMSEIAARLEHIQDSPRGPAVSGLVQAIRAEFERVRVALDAQGFAKPTAQAIA